jgi:predicted XRE-type DNA-binding protein
MRVPKLENQKINKFKIQKIINFLIFFKYF